MVIIDASDWLIITIYPKKLLYDINPLHVHIVRALDKRGYLMIIEDNFSYFSLKPYVVTPHLNHLETVNHLKTVQMRGQNMFFMQS